MDSVDKHYDTLGIVIALDTAPSKKQYLCLHMEGISNRHVGTCMRNAMSDTQNGRLKNGWFAVITSYVRLVPPVGGSVATADWCAAITLGVPIEEKGHRG